MLDIGFSSTVDDEVMAKNGVIKKIVDAGGAAALTRLVKDPARTLAAEPGSELAAEIEGANGVIRDDANAVLSRLEIMKCQRSRQSWS